jgi:hypothetical protein
MDHRVPAPVGRVAPTGSACQRPYASPTVKRSCGSPMRGGEGVREGQHLSSLCSPVLSGSSRRAGSRPPTLRPLRRRSSPPSTSCQGEGLGVGGRCGGRSVKRDLAREAVGGRRRVGQVSREGSGGRRRVGQARVKVPADGVGSVRRPAKVGGRPGLPATGSERFVGGFVDPSGRARPFLEALSEPPTGRGPLASGPTLRSTVRDPSRSDWASRRTASEGSRADLDDLQSVADRSSLVESAT